VKTVYEPIWETYWSYSLKSDRGVDDLWLMLVVLCGYWAQQSLLTSSSAVWDQASIKKVIFEKR